MGDLDASVGKRTKCMWEGGMVRVSSMYEPIESVSVTRLSSPLPDPTSVTCPKLPAPHLFV